MIVGGAATGDILPILTGSLPAQGTWRRYRVFVRSCHLRSCLCVTGDMGHVLAGMSKDLNIS
jgi:hypothetical protein